jgi:hypothetical protein
MYIEVGVLVDIVVVIMMNDCSGGVVNDLINKL